MSYPKGSIGCTSKKKLNEVGFQFLGGPHTIRDAIKIAQNMKSKYFGFHITQKKGTDYDETCPEGWKPLGNYQCEAPSTYEGGCAKISQFRDYSAAMKQNWENGCKAYWPKGVLGMLYVGNKYEPFTDDEGCTDDQFIRVYITPPADKDCSTLNDCLQNSEAVYLTNQITETKRRIQKNKDEKKRFELMRIANEKGIGIDEAEAQYQRNEQERLRRERLRKKEERIKALRKQYEREQQIKQAQTTNLNDKQNLLSRKEKQLRTNFEKINQLDNNIFNMAQKVEDGYLKIKFQDNFANILRFILIFVIVVLLGMLAYYLGGVHQKVNANNNFVRPSATAPSLTARGNANNFSLNNIF